MREMTDQCEQRSLASTAWAYEEEFWYCGYCVFVV